MCVSHCRCKNGVISINRVGGGSTWGAGGFFDELYGTSRYGLGEEEEEEDFLGTSGITKHGGSGIHRGRHVGGRTKGGFNLPELMKYSEYDKKAWSFFKRYEEDI